MKNISDVIPFLIPVILIQVGLQVYSIVNLVRRKKVRFNNKLVWGIIIIMFQMLGAVAYLVLRGDEE